MIKKNTIIFALFTFLYLIGYQILVEVYGFLEFSPVQSGFSDDRKYGIESEVEKNLKRDNLLNIGYWYIAKVSLYFENNYFVLKLLNGFFLILTFHYSVNKIFNIKNFHTFYLFIPSLNVVSKEYVLIFLFLFFYYSVQRAFYTKLISSFVLIGLFRYFYLIFTLIIIMEKKNMYKHILFFFFLIIISVTIKYWDNIYLFIEQYVFIRYVELSSEGSNYSINSETESLSAQHTGNIFYNIFQFFLHPIPANFYFIFNSYYFIALNLQISMIYFVLNIKKVLKQNIVLFVILFSLSSLVIIINMSSNLRYKFFISFIFSCIVLNNLNKTYVEKLCVLILILFHTILVIYSLFYRF